MNAQNTSPGPKTQVRRTGSPAAGGHWWKACVLLTGLGATVLGWMALPRDEPTPVNGTLAPQLSMSAGNAPVLGVRPVDRPRHVPASVRTLPGMPQKPVFQVPVTRTRRS